MSPRWKPWSNDASGRPAEITLEWSGHAKTRAAERFGGIEHLDVPIEQICNAAMRLGVQQRFFIRTKKVVYVLRMLAEGTVRVITVYENNLREGGVA